MNFLIQTVNGKVVHDFCNAIVEFHKYDTWLSNGKSTHSIIYSDDAISTQLFVPIGSIEFVCEFLRKNYRLTPKPINIPQELLSKEFTQRKVKYINYDGKKELSGFVKSADEYKKITEVTNGKIFPPGKYLQSSKINIQSEYRCFVYKNNLVSLKYYSGDFTIFPDISKINEIISAYICSPIAYTLDVGVNKRGTFIIEIHDFFACGLYGWNDWKLIATMQHKWFIEYVRNNKPCIQL